jgi:hypothetical protein
VCCVRGATGYRLPAGLCARSYWGLASSITGSSACASAEGKADCRSPACPFGSLRHFGGGPAACLLATHRPCSSPITCTCTFAVSHVQGEVNTAHRTPHAVHANAGLLAGSPIFRDASHNSTFRAGKQTKYFLVILFVWVYQQECLDKIFLVSEISEISEI